MEINTLGLAQNNTRMLNGGPNVDNKKFIIYLIRLTQHMFYPIHSSVKLPFKTGDAKSSFIQIALSGTSFFFICTHENNIIIVSKVLM